MFSDIIWDFDGTLLDTYPWMTISLKRALEEQGVGASEEEILKRLKISFDICMDYYEEKYNIDPVLLRKRYEYYESSLDIKTIKPFPHVKEICKYVIELKGRNFIYTHRDNLTFTLLKNHDMLKYFTEVVTKEQGLRRKPDAEGFLYIINKYNIDKDKALAVGDRELDLLAAMNSGVKSCLFGDNGDNFSCRPDYVIQSIDELVKIISV